MLDRMVSTCSSMESSEIESKKELGSRNREWGAIY